MPWAAAAAIGGAALQSNASSKAAKAQRGAADAATALQQGQFDETARRNQPFLQGGYDALDMLRLKMPELTASYDPTKLLSEPGYQWGLDQGQKTLEQSLARQGLTDSGAALKAAARYGNDYATTKLNSAFQRDQASKNQIFNILQGQVGTGQASANNTAAVGQQFATNAGANMIGAGDSQAANAMAQGNIWGNLLNQGASSYGRMSSNNSNPRTSQAAWDAAGNGMDNDQMPMQLADGGPVLVNEGGRMVPKVGTRSKIGGSTGGGMSREAVLKALDESRGSTDLSAPAPVSNANPLNPRSVNAEREKAAGLYKRGGEVDGPGGPRDDLIEARLSDGEHVIDAETVNALGDGDNAKGQAVLNELREAAKAHARKKGKKCG